MIRREGDRLVVTARSRWPPSPRTSARAGRRSRRARAASTSRRSRARFLCARAAAGWLREAKRLGGDLAFSNLPQGLTTIAQLYGVDRALPVAAAPPPLS